MAWRAERMKFNEALQQSGSEAEKQAWQRSYMQGQDPSGNTLADYAMKVQMKNLRRS